MTKTELSGILKSRTFY